MLLIPTLDPNAEIAHYEQIYHYFKSEIIAGRLKDNSPLPSIRKLADLLALSTTPIETAYSQLLAEGFIRSKPRSGYVVHKLPESIPMHDGNNETQDHRLLCLREDKEYEYDFHMSKNDFTYFPFKKWQKLTNQTLRSGTKELLFYGNPQGEIGLRKQIASYLHRYRGVKCSADQIIIGSDLYLLVSILSLLLNQHDSRIGVENPGYLTIPATFRQHGYETVPISLESDGINIQELYDSHVRIVSVAPAHQFPKGMTLPISKRLRLIEWSKAVNGYIIEDDYDGEFRYYGKPIPSLQGLVRDANVIYLGGCAQVLAPALCIQYMVIPVSLLEAYRQLYQQLLFEPSSSRLHQRTLELFMEKGYWETHVRKMRKVYRRKHDLLIEALQKYFHRKAEIIGRDAGFHVLLRVSSAKSEAELLQLAKHAGIAIASSAYTWLTNPSAQKEFIIGFAGIEESKIDEGIKLLHDIWFNGA